MNAARQLVGVLQAHHATDLEACRQGEALVLNGGQVHVWAGSRFVCEVSPVGPAAPSRRQAADVLKLLGDGARPAEIARRLGIEQERIYQIVANERAMAD